MFKRMAAFLLCFCMVMTGSALFAHAEAIERSLIIPDKTASPQSDALFSYSEQGALTVTAESEFGGAVAVQLSQLLHVKNMRYLQVSLHSTAPFNIALKMGGTERDIYPQLAGPSWYEALCGTRPDNATSVPAGQYTVSLDLIHYFEYNGLTIDKNGFVDLKTVLIMLEGAGTLKIDRLLLSNTQEFTMPDGQVVAPAPTLPALPEIHETDVTEFREMYENPEFSARSEDNSLLIIFVLIGAGTLIAALAIAAVVKVKVETVTRKEDERYFRAAQEVEAEMAKRKKSKKHAIYSPDRPRPVKSKAEYLKEFKLLGAIADEEPTEDTVSEEATNEEKGEVAVVQNRSAQQPKPKKKAKKKSKKKKK